MIELVKYFVILYGGLFAITNPVGAVPVFLGVTHDLSWSQRREIAQKTAITVITTLVVFALIGEWIFKFFGSSVDAFAIAGGILLFKMAMDMLSGRLSTVKISKEETEEFSEEVVTLEEVAIIPLAIPLISGPGAITTVMLYMAKSTSVPEKATVVASILAIGLTVWLILCSSNRIQERLGRVGIKVMTRMMGLILTSMAVQMIINGIKGAFGL
ncbi:small neutral amino acid transporter A [Thermococcus sp. 4557]|uniref:neutral amino acid NAAT transporter SnatA n=1 Tax=Thermococcus sp. (strain CGMCC 1.5172 / 4557) TaxID=1042877 RepID=UPI000219EF16|nr:neutral amino acid NAAT transporter SnatA [Thermococcus sp. 4557]AEK73686.1 small neutral amino acid transporter A [Thermococcus sp. 4557]